MIPIELKVKGLYSYKALQVINFEKLTTSQLFGIFGSVGSGKSSILEAIMFVLYDRSDRLNKSGDNRYYNMLNLQCDELFIDFVFCTSARQESRYRFCFTAKRNGNNFDKVEVKERCQYQWTAEKWLPIDVADATEILGMTYENFMQAVIIPQGKFREFIDQKPMARTQMLKELFHLQKFDLGARTGSLLKKTELKIADLKARVAEIGQVSEEDIQMHQDELQECEESLRQNQQLLSRLETECQQLEQLKKLFEDISGCQQQWEALQHQQTSFAEKEQQLNAYTKACTYFNEKLNVWSETLLEKRKRTEELTSLETQLSTGEKKRSKASQHLQEKQQLFRQKEQDQQKCDDLEHIIRIKDIQQALQQRQQALTAEKQVVDTLAEQQQTQKERLVTQETELTSLERQMTKQQSLQEVHFWHQTYQQIKQEVHGHQQSLELQEKQRETISEEKNMLLQTHTWITPGTSFGQFYPMLEQRRQALKSKEDAIREQLRDLQVKEKLAGYAEALQEGAACPLCGATHHPAVSQLHSVAREIEQIKSRLEKSAAYERQLLDLERAIHSLEASHQSVTLLIADKKEQLGQGQARYKQHRLAFVWDDYRHKSYEEIGEAVQLQGQQQQQVMQQKETITQLRQQYEQQEEQLTVARENLQQFKDEHMKLDASCQHLFASLRLLEYDKFQEHTLESLKNSLYKGKQRLLEIDREYEQAQKNYNEADRALGMLEGKKESVQNSLNELGTKAEAIDVELQALCTEKKFDNLQQVKELLDLELDIDAVHQEIMMYKNQVHNTEVTLHKLRTEAQGQTYDELAHRQAVSTCQELKLEAQKLQESCTLSRRHIADMLERRKKGQEMLLLLEVAQVREANLKELTGLFRGSGFVNYASTVLLDNLCRAANHRFMQLTKNNLSLELNESNDFVVRDYLNNGRTRLLKTLSGGQTFQAALCLALSLAENVKALNQSDQSFFFLDEGFGSLDRESLRVVFDTLKSLRQEKRIVGIISHVEELQQEIDVYLTVHNDKERGSLVECSWEQHT